MVAFAKLYDANGTTLVAGYDYDGLNRRVVKAFQQLLVRPRYACLTLLFAPS